MNRYIPTLGFSRVGRESLREDFVDYLLLLTHKTLPKAKVPEVKQGYELLKQDLALGVALIDMANDGRITEKDAQNAVEYCTRLHTLFLDSFYDEEFLNSEAYIQYKKDDRA